MNGKQYLQAISFLILFGAIGLGLASYGIYRRTVESNLARMGTHVIGTVTRRGWDTMNSAGHPERQSEVYSLEVSYAAGKAVHDGEFQCTRKAFDSHVEGSQIEVIYDPGDPDNSMLSGDQMENPSSKYILFGLLFAVGSSGIVIWVTMYYRSAREPDVPDLEEALLRAERGDSTNH